MIMRFRHSGNARISENPSFRTLYMRKGLAMGITEVMDASGPSGTNRLKTTVSKRLSQIWTVLKIFFYLCTFFGFWPLTGGVSMLIIKISEYMQC